jgi:hypothetical protein
MSDKRVSEMTDDEVRGLADAAGTWKPDAYYEARQAIVRDAKAQGKELITWKAWPGACSDITYAEPLEGIRIALTRASAARRAVDDYVKIAREEGRTWAQVGQALGLAETAADRGVPMAEAAFEYVVRSGRTVSVRRAVVRLALPQLRQVRVRPGPVRVTPGGQRARAR